MNLISADEDRDYKRVSIAFYDTLDVWKIFLRFSFFYVSLSFFIKVIRLSDFPKVIDMISIQYGSVCKAEMINHGKKIYVCQINIGFKTHRF